jgi:RNA polymerase sigma-70 factor (ECF subfamily)
VGADDDFDEFYRSAGRRLVGQLYAVTGDLQDAEDCVQEALTRAAGRWRQLREYDAPEAWVRRVALNLAASGARRRARKLRALVRLGPPRSGPPPSENAVLVARELARIPMPQRQALVLHYLLDLPVDQVAAELGISPSSVKTRLFRARRTLATTLGDEAQERSFHE